MNPKPKQILRQLDKLSRIEPNNEAVEQALAHARAKLAGLAAEHARPLPFNRKIPSLRSRHMFPRVAALVFACAAIVAIVVLFISPGGQSQFAFAQVIEKVQQTHSLAFKTKGEGPDGQALEEIRILILPDGKMRAESAIGYSIQDIKSHKMIMVQKENKTVQIFEGFSPPAPEIDKINVYELIRNIRKDAIENLPDEEIDGRKAMVFRVEMKELSKIVQSPTCKVWVDPKTELPIHLELIADVDKGKQVKQVMYDIEFDQPIDPSLFSFTPPEGYTVQTSGITNFPELPNKPELLAPEIIPGVGIGPIRFGMSREKIESLIGKPDGYEDNQTSLLYYSRGFTLSVSHRSGLKKITCISQMHTLSRVRDFAGKTKEGIGIGSSLQEVENVFGKPDRDEGLDASNNWLFYPKLGFVIQFVNDKVISINMREVSTQTEESSDDRNDSAKKQEPKTTDRTLKINVIGPDSKPVSGVKIRDGVWYKNNTAKMNREHVCDAQGQTVIELPSSFDTLRLFTSCNGYVPQFVHWEQLDENPPDTYTIKLTKGTLIGGFVKNEEGQPIVGAKVEVMLVLNPGEDQKRTCFTHWLATEDAARITDVNGRWTLDNVPEGEVKLSLRISHPQYIGDKSWGDLQKEQKITLKDLRQQNCVIILHRK